MKFKGTSPLLTASGYKRNEDGSFSFVKSYVGKPSDIESLINNSVGKPTVNKTTSGAFESVDLTWANTTSEGVEEITEKWEDDTETLERDILYSERGQALSEDAKKEFVRWRKEPDSELNTVFDPQLNTDAANLNALKEEVLRGVETISIKTVVLKRTRTVPSGYLTPRQIVVTESFYSTNALIAAENIPVEVVSQLPNNPVATPSNAAWGWMPRNSSRQFTGRGKAEETSDWVFAAWSTNLYDLIS